MDQAGLIAKIQVIVTTIYQGRQWLDTDGLEHEGRISYTDGLIHGLEAFREAQTHAAEDLYVLFTAEYTFLGQELEFCTPEDNKARNSLSKAIKEFDEAFLALEFYKMRKFINSWKKLILHARNSGIRECPRMRFM